MRSETEGFELFKCGRCHAAPGKRCVNPAGQSLIIRSHAPRIDKWSRHLAAHRAFFDPKCSACVIEGEEARQDPQAAISTWLDQVHHALGAEVYLADVIGGALRRSPSKISRKEKYQAMDAMERLGWEFIETIHYDESGFYRRTARVVSLIKTTRALQDFGARG